MTRSKHRSEDFKKESVRLVILNKRKIKQVAEELGVNHWTLKDWVERYGKEIHTELVTGGLKGCPVFWGQINKRGRRNLFLKAFVLPALWKYVL